MARSNRKRILPALVALGLTLLQLPIIGITPAVAVDYSFLVSDETTRQDPVTFDGMIVTGEVFAFVQPNTAINRVRFYIDDPTFSDSPFSVDKNAPYDLGGTRGNGRAKPFKTSILDDGLHTITARINNQPAGLTATVQVVNDVVAAVSDAPDRSDPEVLEGATLSGDAFIFGQPGPGFGVPNIARVSFSIDGGDWSSDREAPYDLVGSVNPSTALPFDTTQLDDGDHEMRVRVNYQRNGGAVRIQTSTFTVANGDDDPPSAPTGLIAAAGDGQVDLSWDPHPEPGVTYSVYRSTSPGVATTPANRIATGLSDPSHLDENADNGTTYHYVVTAVDGSDNESDASNEVSATPEDMAAPPSPQNLTATAGDGQVSLGWDAVSEAGVTYSVYRSTSPGVATTQANRIVSGLTGTAHFDDAVTNDTTYHYVVTAVDGADNESDPSNEASATPSDEEAPSAPTGLIATAGDGQVDLSWDPHPESGVTYSVYRSTSPGVATTPANRIASGLTDPSHLDADATNGTTYHYVVTATDDSDNESDPSNEASATPEDTVAPDAPQNLVATPGDEQVSLEWDAVAGAAGYRVYRSEAPITDLASAELVGSPTLSLFTDEGLTNGTTYHYVVTAVDDADNESAPSNEATATPADTTPPDAPVISAVLVDDDIVVSWAAVDDAASYDVYRSTTPGVSATGDPYATVTDAGFTDEDLDPDGTTYHYVVVAVDEASNRSGASNEASATVSDTTAPDAPQNLVATAGVSQVELSWDPVAGAANYDVYRSTTSPVTIDDAHRVGDGVLTTSYIDTEPEDDGTTYFYVVTARDLTDNESDPSNEASVTMNDATAPAAPTNLIATAGDGQVDLSWDPHPESGVTYSVYRSTSPGVATTPANRIASGLTDPSHLDADATNGTTYHYVVTATDDSDNESDPSNEASATPEASTCPPYSMLPCNQIAKELPLSLTFDGTEGGLLDGPAGGAVGTGFTMVQPKTGNAGDPYMPEKLSVNGGTLTITTTNGIQYRVPGQTGNANTLDNGLGVGIDPSNEKLRLETTIVNAPQPGSNSAQQAGIWFGPDEDNYAKLVIASATNTTMKVQLLVEVAGGNIADTDATKEVAPAELNSNVPAPGFTVDPVGKTIRLTMVVDPVANTVTGSYSVDGGAVQNLGTLPITSVFSEAQAISSAIPGATTTAGIFATHRNGVELSYPFGEFSITEVDSTAPATPTGLTATPGDGSIALDWDDNDEPDLDGYHVYRSTRSPVPLTAEHRITMTPISASELLDPALRDGVEYHYAVVAVDETGNTSAAATASATPNGEVEPVDLRVNFQSETAPVPTGYVRDWGQPFGPRTAVDQGTGWYYGWLADDTTNPLSLVGNGRDRDSANPDQRLDTLMHMRANDIAGSFNGVKAAGDWEVALPDGVYDVTVAVGDPNPGADPEVHTIGIEGTPAITGFVPTGAAGSATRHSTATLSVAVTDGHLTVEADGGTNTKIDYLDIVTDQTGPAAPTGLAATPGDGQVSLTWNDVDGAESYDVYRSIESPVVIDDAHRVAEVTDPMYIDTAVTNGTEYFYVVTARDLADNESDPSNEVAVTPNPGPCVPYSALPCDQITQALPFDLTFDGTEGGLAAGSGGDTGFTMVQPHLPVGVDPYLPGNLNIAGDALTITTTNGIQYKAPGTTTGASNLLDNALGVGVDASTGVIRLETTLSGLPNFRNGSSEQAGIWIGPDQDDYVKLVVGASGATDGSARIQLLREVGGASAGTDEVNSDNQALGGATVRLVLTIDADAGTAEASYAVGAGPSTTLGSFTIPSEIVDSAAIAAAIPGATTTAGIFATHRNATSPTSFTFTGFSIAEAELDTTPPAVPVNLTAVAGDANVSLDWDDVTDEDLATYRVYRSETEGELGEEIGTPIASGFTDTTAVNGTTYWYSVSAEDAAGNESEPSEQVSATPEPASCPPYSILPCSEIARDVPFTLTFDGSEGGLPDDSAGGAVGTGFTMVQPHRGSASDPYIPQNLHVENGQLTITTTSGIQYRTGDETTNANTLDNGLGVGIDASADTLRFETTLLNPPAGTNNSQQAGLWFGPDDDNYVKLVAISTNTSTVKIQLLSEVGGGAEGDPGTAPLQLDSTTTTIAANQMIRLILVVNPVTGVVAGSYQLGAGPETSLTAPSSFTVPSSFFEDPAIAAALPGATTTAGIFATHRTGPSSLEYAFGEFSVAQVGDDDTTPPLAPTGLAAIAGDSQVVLDWNDNLEGDLDGYHVYRSTSSPVDTTGTPISGADPIAVSQFVDGTAANGTTYHYAVTAVDLSGNESPPSAEASATPDDTGEPPFSLNVNFQSAAAEIPNGYVRDFGQPYGPRTDSGQGVGLSYGWVEPGTSTPRDLSVGGTTPGNGRERNLNPDQRLDTFMHMQGDDVPSFNGTPLPGSWEIAVPAGSYDVTVAVGDPQTNQDPEIHSVTVEGVAAITDFVPTGAVGSATHHAVATVPVVVTDGRLTIDAVGTNTKIDYVDIEGGAPDNEAPSAPTGLVATAGSGVVSLNWSDNPEPDLAGYNVYRSETLPVPTSTPLNASLVPGSAYDDPTVQNDTTYHYVVTAVDLNGNESPASASAGGTPTAAAIDVKVNFQSAAAAIPPGYVRDFGQPYGARTLTGQGTGLTYGWVEPGTSTPRDLSVGGSTPGNGRDRNLNADQRLDTLMHMQANHVSGTFNGTPLPGSWEIAVPNGTYTATVAVGDPQAGADPEAHTINVEGNTAIDAFVPAGVNGSATRHATATVTVRVQDGRLTLDAGGGTNTKVNYVDVASDAAGATRPAVTGITPATAATGVPRDSGIAATVSLPNVGEGVDQNTLDATSVQLVRASDQAPVPSNLNTSGGGDIIVIQPTVLLDPNTKYVVRITDDVHDTSGAGFLPFTSTFTTGTAGGPSGGGPASFEKVAGVATGQNFTSVTVGPDGKLYAATLEGLIIRYTIAADGTLTSPQTITSLQAANGGNRMLMGMDFDPAATAANPILWVTHSAYAFNGGPDWAGKLTRLSGPNLETVQDYVVNLPRSIRDHLTNGVQFGPDGKIYFLQGSNSAMGAPDNAWGNRNEHLLTAAVLVFDPSLVSTPPLDVKTEEGGTYNPFAPGAPLKLYATGTRNAWDLVWHSNGNLYVPTNGSAAGGNTPGTPTSLPASCQNRIDDATNGDYTGPQVSGITNVTATQNDFLFRVVQGGYYGHPNPSRCEWVLNGGNPTAGTDVAQVAQYPVGTQPDRNWRGSAYNFGNNKSPNGVIEYQSNLFGGSLKGKLLVIRYSQNDDVIALTPGASGDITAEQTGIPGLTGFVDPLDLTEDPATGNLYITELGAQRISLARAQSTGPGAGDVAVSPARLVFNDVQNGAASASQSVTIDNEGDEILTVSNVSISGLDASQFEITGGPSFQAMVPAGGSITVTVAFDPTSIGPKGAFLDIATDDPETPLTQTVLRGLGTLGLGGGNEPSLQWILDTWQIDVNVGDPDPTNNALPTTPLIGDEVSVPLFQRATDGPVTVEPLAVFGPDGANPVVNFGWYPAGNPGGRQQLFTVSNSPTSNAQTLNVPANGPTSFDPGTQSFGFSSIWPFFSNREVFQEDARNTFSGAIPHHVRVYPLEDASGAVVPDSYVVATEETTSGFDYQDIVVIVHNVEPASPPNDSEISVENLDGVPFPDRLAFSRIGSLASPPSNGVHDVATVRIRNTGVDPLTVSSLQFSGPWQLNTAVSLPAQIAPGAFLDVAVKFVATSGSNHEGTLTIVSNDADEPSTVVELGGFWQSVSEGGQEPDISEIVEVFGYTTEIVGAGEDLNQNGLVTAVGEEILSPYWRRADTTKAVSVRQLAAFHTQGNTATVFFHAKGSNTTSTIFTHAGIDGQSILPRLSGQLGQPAAGSFTPASAVFGFKVDGEWSDPTKNNQTTDQSNGCPTPCGHHVRFWPVRDRAGSLIPDTYLMSMDYSGINYDYNDNVYLISNIAPEDPALDPTAQAPVPGAPNLVLDFDKAYPGSLVDAGGETIGFLGTQANELDTTVGSNSYQPALLDIDTGGAGTLAVTTTIGSNANDDNTLVNGLQLPFDGTHGEFVVSARMLGPVSQLNQGARQGGVMFGRNQENYIKVVAINKGGAPSIEFFSEIGGTGATVGATPAIPNPAAVETIDVALLADPDSRTVRAAYRAVGTGFDTGLVVLPTAVTLSGPAGGRFFEQQGRAGIITMHKGSAAPITVTFDRFAVEAGDPTDGPDTREALHRLDVAGAGEYTDTNGDVWVPDTGMFSPAGAISEGATVNPQEIANTDDDVIYRTYRGNVGNVPIAQRVLTYNIPTFGLDEMDLRLHFAERAAGNDLPGERVFDVEAEGATILDDFDIVAASGGQHTAIVVPVNGVEVNDGSLTLVFRAVADYPSIAGIEVLCPGTCPEPDTTPPAAPTGLTATASPAGIALDWDNNTESDLAGYNVYRASSAGGPFTKITDSPSGPSQYLDATAPSGATSFYEVRAVDTSGNESDPATADATMPVVESAIRINAGGTTQSTGGLTWEGCASTGACNGYVSGGFPYTEPGAPAIAAVPAGMNQAIFQTEWTGGQTNGVPVGGTAFTFDVPLDAGSYLVRLYFAELNKNGAGLRVFDVNIEGGALELNDYDIWSKVGYRTATVEEFTTTVSDGSLTIQFIREIENAKVSAIEIVPLGSGVPGTTTARVNAGGGAQTVGALTWAGCASVGTCSGQVAGGFPYTEPGAPAIAAVPAGMNQTIFQTEWTGGQTNGVPVGGTAFTFDIPVTDGDYVIKLYFAELNKNGPGLRMFDVNIEGGPLELNDYDIWSKVGYRTATVEQFTKTITDGSVTIQFVREIENAKISAIEIVPAAA